MLPCLLWAHVLQSTSGVCAHHILHHAQQYLQHDMFGPPAAAATATGGSTSGNTVKTPFEAADAGGNIVDLFCESLAVFSCDLQYIQQGHYKLPWDAAAFPALEQHNPLMLAARCERCIRHRTSCLYVQQCRLPVGLTLLTRCA